MLSPNIPTPLFGVALLLKGSVSLGGRGEGDRADLSATADASPFAYETPHAEKIALHGEAIKPRHIFLWLNATKPHGIRPMRFLRCQPILNVNLHWRHARSLEIVEWLTL
jgi:hypothetical protein